MVNKQQNKHRKSSSGKTMCYQQEKIDYNKYYSINEAAKIHGQTFEHDVNDGIHPEPASIEKNGAKILDLMEAMRKPRCPNR